MRRNLKLAPKRRTRSEDSNDTDKSNNKAKSAAAAAQPKHSAAKQSAMKNSSALESLISDLSGGGGWGGDDNSNNNNNNSDDGLNLSMTWDTDAHSAIKGGGGLSLTRQQKTAKKPRREQQREQQQEQSTDNNDKKSGIQTSSLSAAEDAAAVPEASSSSSASAQPKKREVKKYQSFVRDASASQQQLQTQRDAAAAATKKQRTPFDDFSSSTSATTATAAQPQPQQQQHSSGEEHHHNKRSHNIKINHSDEPQKTGERKEEQESPRHEHQHQHPQKHHHKHENPQQQQQQQQQQQPQPRAEAPTTEQIMSSVHSRLASAIKDKLSFASLTYVQRAAWLPITATTNGGGGGGGGDVIIRSETGSGKTLAYSLPLLHKIIQATDEAPHKKIDRSSGTIMIVMTPTRELAEQCSLVISKLVSRAAFLVVGSIHGGDDRHHEKSRLRKGINILVCTPGRLLDHLTQTNSFRCDNLRFIVLDEADRLLDMGFERSIREIMSKLPEPEKRVLVSATVTNAVERLSHFVLQPPITMVGQSEDVYEVPDTLTQRFVNVPAKHRLVCLGSLLWSRIFSPASSAAAAGTQQHSHHQQSFKNTNQKIVVFVSTSDAVEFLFLLFSRLASPFLASVSAQQHQHQRVAAATRGVGGAKFSVKKRTEEANQHLNDGGGYGGGGNNVVEFDDDDDDDDEIGGLGAGVDRRVAQAAHAHKLLQHGNKAGGSGSSLSDESAFLKGTDVFKLHGNMSQVDRQAVYESFKASSCAVLFCTDVAARGLDIPGVNLIIHYDPPIDEKCYVHRVGRTARIGTSGESILFLMPHEVGYVDFLSAATRKRDDDDGDQQKNKKNQQQQKEKDEAAGAGDDAADQSGGSNNNNRMMSEISLDVILFNLSKMDRKAGPGRHWVHSAAFLQQAMCELTKNDTHLKQVSLFAYQSYIRAYAGVPRQVKQFFNQRELHLGHIASSFANAGTPAQLQRELRIADTARRAKVQARDVDNIKRHGIKIDNTDERYHSTLRRKAMFETKDRIDSGQAQGKIGATSSKAMTEFEA